MEEQITIVNRFGANSIRFNIIFPEGGLYRGLSYNFYIKITCDKNIPKGWYLDFYTNSKISEIIRIKELSKEYTIRYSYIDKNGFIRVISMPLYKPKKTPNLIFSIKIKIKYTAPVGINKIINKGIITHIEPEYENNNILDEYNYEKRIVMDEINDRVIIENKFVRIL